MSEIIVRFRTVGNQETQSYAKHRLASFSTPETSEQAEASPLPVASLEKLSSATTQAVDPHLNLEIISEINQSFPLMANEYQVQLLTTYLVEEWEGLPPGTMVLQQTTNLAVTDFIVSTPEETEAAPTSPHDLAANGSPNLDGAASTLAKGLVKLLPPPADLIGATMLAAFWPKSGSDTQWMQIYKAMEELLRSGLAEHDIQTASRKVDGFVLFLHTEYMVAKPSSTKKELMALLAPYAKDFYTDIINVLMFTDPEKVDIAISALLNFMTAACMQMALNQERALIDPKVRTPAKSEYAEVVQKLIDEYLPYAENKARELKERRLAQISEVERRCDIILDRSVCKSWFKDSADGTEEVGVSNESIKKKREEHYNRVRDDLDALLNQEVYGPIENWKKLRNNPVPQD